MKRTSNGILLLSLVLLVSSAILACISGNTWTKALLSSKFIHQVPFSLLCWKDMCLFWSSGQRIDGISTRMTGANNIVISGDTKGCFPDSSRRKGAFCCNKDHMCWPSLQDCLPNCPCCAKDIEPKRSPIYGWSSVQMEIEIMEFFCKAGVAVY